MCTSKYTPTPGPQIPSVRQATDGAPRYHVCFSGFSVLVSYPEKVPFSRLLLQAERRTFFRLRRWAGRRASTRDDTPAHLQTGERGEDLAFFFLRDLGYTLVARRWHAARLRGDLDLVGWDGDTLVIFEVKTRTAHDLAPAEAAVNSEKQRMLRRMALAYRGRLPAPWRDLLPIRFDVVSVYDLPAGPEIQHFRNAFPLVAASGG